MNKVGGGIRDETGGCAVVEAEGEGFGEVVD